MCLIRFFFQLCAFVSILLVTACGPVTVRVYENPGPVIDPDAQTGLICDRPGEVRRYINTAYLGNCRFGIIPGDAIVWGEHWGPDYRRYTILKFDDFYALGDRGVRRVEDYFYGGTRPGDIPLAPLAP